MKTFLLALAACLALTQVSRADVTVTLSNVHLCCDKCVKTAEKVTSVDGAKGVADKTAKTVVITAPDTAAAQKAVDALTEAGFYGTSSDSSIKVNSDTGATGQKVQSLKIEHIHVCCPHCVKSIDAALKDVPGVTGNTAQKGVSSFEVTGDFTDSDVMAALQKAGFTGTVAK